MASVPVQPKIYHILHHDRLPYVLNDGFLFSDSIVSAKSLGGTMIGMSTIKKRRLTELTLTSHPDLYVGQCCSFLFLSSFDNDVFDAHEKFRTDL